MLPRHSAPGEATVADHAVGGRAFDIILKQLSHPELGDIRIDENLFAIGRNEAPFESYAPDVIADLSRRHARIFSEDGAVYIADLGSKNGTTVNGQDISQKTSRLNDGDEICFGKALSYRVRLGARAQTSARKEKLISLTLTPERGDLGIQPIVITQFPFLIGKTDEAFARYKDKYPQQVNYLSRRHAHIFLKSGSPFVEDLGSTNGTFVAGKRLDEHAVRLGNDEVIAFGGHHFVYRISMQTEAAEIDPTVTKLSPTARGAVTSGASAAHAAGAAGAVNADKTTFVGAAGSFLDIFCVDQVPPQDEEVNEDAQNQPADAARETGKRKARGKLALFVSELGEAFAGGEAKAGRRGMLWSATAVIAAGIVALALYTTGGAERNLKSLVEKGEYERAATIAAERLAQEPDNAEIKALGTEALLKAHLPGWLNALQAGEFDRADAILSGMKRLGGNNADAQPLLDELEWIGNLERFVLGRGGPDAPIRIYADEDRLKTLVKRWDDDTQAHQRAFTAISSYVPEFRDRYAEALSHLRKLKNDDSVYLSAIERLKTSMVTELNRDKPEALDAVLKEFEEKYPRIGGLDSVREDLRQYTAISNEAGARNLRPLAALLQRAKFSTPPFQAKFDALKKSGALPPAEVVQQYQTVSKAWRAGDTQQAFVELQKITAAPWAGAAATELERKKSLLEQFTQLQKMRGAQGYDERLLAFHGSLDADEDVYFIRATAQDIAAYKDKALARAQESLNRAQESWRQYRENGGIEAAQRLERAISNRFRSQSRLLAEAHANAQQGTLIYTQLKIQPAAQWSKLRDEIGAEAEQQRASLEESRAVLEPSLLKAKLALLKGQVNEERQSSKTAD
ncbi:FHA domain-containing protein [Noviherbaspirillum cavernae]|uniref:FHA domain-containing protein n=1 Tax=Noviherbaspirillum cavernae TaxID=2320862 RepID=A0A418WZB4_9BURK|nr:FHA domain-containing protein [Noviherbaspirillum cavernae]RJG05556.1 FHA domain-containing protein [Noviherbaspirillum cavernae]